MVGNGVPENGKCRGVTGEAGGSAKGVLLVLLALAVCFGYFYFFTDILRSKEETPTQPEVYTSEVKKPLPARPAGPAAVTTEQTAPVSPAATAPAGNAPAVSPQQATKETKVAGNAAVKKETAAPAPATKIAQKPGPGDNKHAVAPAPVRTPPAPSKPLAAAPKEVKAAAKPAPEKQKDVKPVAKQAQPSVKQKTVAAKPAPAPAKTATVVAGAEKAKTPAKDTHTLSTDRKKVTAESKGTAAPVSAKDSGTRQRPATASKEVVAKPEKAGSGDERPEPATGGGKFTLVVGTYVLKSSMLADKAKLERAGLKPSVSAGRKMSEPMNRLLVAEFGSYSSARSELNRVRKTSKDAFLLQEKGRFTVYAGSYFRHERALQEQERLRRQGFVPIVKKSDAPVSTFTLTSGNFPTREAALKEAARLRKLGFKPLPSSVKKQ
jgi:hypothetical protein